MALEFKEYDMRRFSIKDQKDVYAFFDVLEKAIPQIRALTKRLVMENAAKASVINNLTRKQAENIPRLNLGADEDDGIIKMADPSLSTFEQERQAILEKMRQSRDAVDAASEQLKAAPSNQAKDDLGPILDEKTPYSASQSATEGIPEEDFAEEDDDLSRIVSSDYTRQVTTRGVVQWRFKGILCRSDEVPEDVKALLTPKGE